MRGIVNLRTLVDEVVSDPNVFVRDKPQEEDVSKSDDSHPTHERSQPKYTNWSAAVACGAWRSSQSEDEYNFNQEP